MHIAKFKLLILLFSWITLGSLKYWYIRQSHLFISQLAPLSKHIRVVSRITHKLPFKEGHIETWRVVVHKLEHKHLHGQLVLILQMGLGDLWELKKEEDSKVLSSPNRWADTWGILVKRSLSVNKCTWFCHFAMTILTVHYPAYYKATNKRTRTFL